MLWFVQACFQAPQLPYILYNVFRYNTLLPMMAVAMSVFLYYLQLTEAYKNPDNWSEESRDIIRRHAAWMDDLGKQGILGFAGRTLYEPGDSRLFGIALLVAPSIEKAREIMADDPAVVHGIQQAEIHPYSLAIRHLQNLT